MRALLIILTTAIATLCGTAQKLPVLHVDFPGNFNKGMDYVGGSMSLTDERGKTVELPAMFKTRGATALNYSMKPSFNMKLKAEDGTEIDSTLLGLRSCSSWILDAMAIDQICMRNRVCFDVWNEFTQLPYFTDFDNRNGTVGKFVEVYINGEYKGIYCLTDRINRKLLNLKKTKTGVEGDTIRGVLYKHGTTDIGDQNTAGFFNDYMVCVAAWHDAWELKYPDEVANEESWEPLLDYYKNKSDYEYVSNHFDLENLADYTLFVMAFSIGDNWGNKNKYFSIRNVLKNDFSGRFIVTPWDLDTSLGGNYNGNYYGGNYSNWPVKSVASSASPPFSTCLRRAEFKEMIKERWTEIREYELSVESVARKLYNYCELFYATGAWQRQCDWVNSLKYKPKHCSDLRSEVNLVVEWYQNRFQEMDEYFGIEATAISDTENNTPLKEGTGMVFDLQGRRINGTPGTGLYIKNGRKYIIPN